MNRQILWLVVACVAFLAACAHEPSGRSSVSSYSYALEDFGARPADDFGLGDADAHFYPIVIAQPWPAGGHRNAAGPSGFAGDPVYDPFGLWFSHDPFYHGTSAYPVRSAPPSARPGTVSVPAAARPRAPPARPVSPPRSATPRRSQRDNDARATP